MLRPIQSAVLALVAVSAPLVSTSAQAAPRTLWNELRIGSGGAANPIFGVNGLTRFQPSGRGSTVSGLSTTYGRFLGEELAVGMTVFLLRNPGQTTLGLSPFVKYLRRSGPRAFYAEGSMHAWFGDNDFFGPGVDLGFERFVTEYWSLRAGPTYRLLFVDSDTLHIIGIGWGLSAYF